MSSLTRIPPRVFRAIDHPQSIDALLQHWYSSRRRNEQQLRIERSVLGYPLPVWQRDFVWTDVQCVRFVESAWLGFHLGVFVWNRMDWDANGKPTELSGLLIDGQQRLRALERYFLDEFAVFGLTWSNLNDRERRRFGHVLFASAEVEIEDEAQLRELYDRLNFGGTPHTPAQRAQANA